MLDRMPYLMLTDMAVKMSERMSSKMSKRMARREGERDRERERACGKTCRKDQKNSRDMPERVREDAKARMPEICHSQRMSDRLPEGNVIFLQVCRGCILYDFCWGCVLGLGQFCPGNRAFFIFIDVLNIMILNDFQRNPEPFCACNQPLKSLGNLQPMSMYGCCFHARTAPSIFTPVYR